MLIVPKDTLPTVRIDGEVAAHIFDGAGHGSVASSAFIVDLAPDRGPRRHTHPYPEVFVVVEGVVRVEADGTETDLTPDQICVVPAGAPHTFVNAGPGRARMVNIHASSEVVTEFTGDDPVAQGSYEYGARPE